MVGLSKKEITVYQIVHALLFTISIILLFSSIWVNSIRWKLIATSFFFYVLSWATKECLNDYDRDEKFKLGGKDGK